MSAISELSINAGHGYYFVDATDYAVDIHNDMNNFHQDEAL